jgi:hypothetical protein
MAMFNSFLYVYQRVNFLSPNRVFFRISLLPSTRTRPPQGFGLKPMVYPGNHQRYGGKEMSWDFSMNNLSIDTNNGI